MFRNHHTCINRARSFPVSLTSYPLFLPTDLRGSQWEVSHSASSAFGGSRYYASSVACWHAWRVGFVATMFWGVPFRFRTLLNYYCSLDVLFLAYLYEMWGHIMTSSPTTYFLLSTSVPPDHNTLSSSHSYIHPPFKGHHFFFLSPTILSHPSCWNNH